MSQFAQVFACEGEMVHPFAMRFLLRILATSFWPFKRMYLNHPSWPKQPWFKKLMGDMLVYMESTALLFWIVFGRVHTLFFRWLFRWGGKEYVQPMVDQLSPGLGLGWALWYPLINGMALPISPVLMKGVNFRNMLPLFWWFAHVNPSNSTFKVY